MSRGDSWEGAIVRGRDRRKGRVEADHRPLLRRGRASVLVVHWDDHEVTHVPRAEVTMLRPPVGFVESTPIATETRWERMERTGPWWSGIVALVCLVLSAAVIIWAVAAGVI